MTTRASHQDIPYVMIGGIPYDPREGGGSFDTPPFLRELFAFLADWFDDSPTLIVHTSGSTGKPKALRVEKARMMESARLTCSFLRLRAGDTALLCMPLQYIAGKMMVVRALVAGLDLLPVTPSGHPLKGLAQAPVLAAMVPLQVIHSLQVPEEKALLRQITHLLIGGGPIDPTLAQALKTFPNAVWSTYGMTETLSHVALRRLSGPQATDLYTPLEGVHVRLSQEGTLVIHAPCVCREELTTNDVAQMDDTGRHFRILGRRDNTIISGGVKIQMEQVEAALQPHLARPFTVTSAPDARFGEIVVLLVEGPLPEGIDALCRRILTPYQRPKRILSVPRIPLTGTGKPDRARAKAMAREQGPSPAIDHI
ncbi:MAG: AMP-binding protein [Prevotellaceae bacterium]|nr:AMP-binding protein [Prevotellaceae bacterium]